MRIIAYTYDADVHCPDCAKERFHAHKGMTKQNRQDMGFCDEHGIDYSVSDREGNTPHPVFDTDAHGDYSHCGDCFIDLE